MITIVIKMLGLVLVLFTFGLAESHAPVLAWIGSLGAILIFLANFFGPSWTKTEYIANVMIISGTVFAGWGLLNVGTWWGWLGLFLLFCLFEMDGEPA